jgi:hypothetical protein
MNPFIDVLDTIFFLDYDVMPDLCQTCKLLYSQPARQNFWATIIKLSNVEPAIILHKSIMNGWLGYINSISNNVNLNVGGLICDGTKTLEAILNNPFIKITGNTDGLYKHFILRKDFEIVNTLIRKHVTIDYGKHETLLYSAVKYNCLPLVDAIVSDPSRNPNPTIDPLETGYYWETCNGNYGGIDDKAVSYAINTNNIEVFPCGKNF